MVGQTNGSPGGPSAGGADAWLARYDSAGNQLWIRQLGTSEADHAHTAASDGTGGVYVGGLTRGDLGGVNAGIADAWLGYFDGSGNQQWVEQFGTSVKDHIHGSSLDGTGGVYIAGWTEGSLGGSSLGNTDTWLARYDSNCLAPGAYCVASATSIPGCQAALTGSGSPSLANPAGFTISSGRVPGGNVGICFFGKNGQAAFPFGTLGGQICVQPPVFRSKPKNSGGTKGNCDGVFTFTLQDLMDKSPIVFAGAILDAQIWARDPANPDGFLLSDGLEFTVCP